MAKPKANANVELLNNVFVYMFDYAKTKKTKQVTTASVICIENLARNTIMSLSG